MNDANKIKELEAEVLSLRKENLTLKTELQGSAIDITEHKKAVEALRQSQKLFYQVFNSIPIPIWIVTAKDKKYVEVNDIFVKRNGLIKEKILGEKVTYWIEIDYIKKFFELVQQNGIVINYEASYPIMTGEPKDFLLTGVAIKWEGEDCILTIANDITTLRKYQNEFLRLNNLNVIGQMAASIAHEVRNPMTTVKGLLQLLGSKENYNEDREYMDLMIEELDRANMIISDYLTISNKNIVEIKPQNLNAIIKTVFPLLQANAIENDINIHLQLNEIPELMFDKDEMRQLILNLVRNGIEAMPSGGFITIRTYQNGNEVTLAIQDQGIGINQEVLKEIGTPFFTTKDNGTGLGLSVCYKIAKRYHARIDIDTSPEGTVFNVIFPILMGFI